MPQVTGILSHRRSQGASPFFVVEALVAHEVLKCGSFYSIQFYHEINK